MCIYYMEVIFANAGVSLSMPDEVEFRGKIL